MSLTTDLKLAYQVGYDDALAKRKPDPSKTEVLGSSNCTNSERTSDERGTCMNDAPEPYYFACSSCGTCLNWNPNFCPYCGAEVIYE